MNQFGYLKDQRGYCQIRSSKNILSENKSIQTTVIQGAKDLAQRPDAGCWASICNLIFSHDLLFQVLL